MKTIGIIGITAEGASDCYKKIVKLAGQKLGANKHPEIVLVNPSFDVILAAQKQRDWQGVADSIIDAGRKCVAAGADFIIMPANSVHFAYDIVAKQLDVPVLNIVDVVVGACKSQEFKKVAVLGVGITMTDGLYDKALEENNIEQVKLGEHDAKELDGIIYNELVRGIVNQASVEKILAMCARLANQGCEALALACTELQMVLTKDNSPLPILDSTELLAVSAVAYAIE